MLSFQTNNRIIKLIQIIYYFRIDFIKEARMPKRRISFDAAMMDSNAAMNKALRYEPPDEIYLTGNLQSFVKVGIN